MTGGKKSLSAAHGFAIFVPLCLLGGALMSQYLGGLYPCEMCMWQRWPHVAALVLGSIALLVPQTALKRGLILLAGLAILISGIIGAFHAGVEYGWWEGLTTCSSGLPSGGSTEDLLNAIMESPVVRCDQVQWELFGISLAGFNFIFSGLGALIVFVLLGKSRTA